MIPARPLLRRNLLGAALAAALFAVTAPARGGTPAAEANASALFQDAKALAERGDYEQALAKYQEAQRLSPTLGTLLNVAACLEKLGRVASSWGTYKQVEVQARNAGDTDREQEAQRRAQALAPLLAKLAIVVPPVARLAGLEVRRDGEVVGEGQWGSPLPVDPGQHTVEASAPKHKPWSTVVRIDANGSAASIEVPALEEGGPAAAGGSVWGPQRIAGAAVGGAGIAGIVVGSVFGVIAISKKNESNAGYCNSADVCDPMGKSLRADGIRAGNVSTGAFIGGAIALAGGLALFFTAPARTSKGAGADAGVALLVGPGDIRLVGRW